MRHRSSLQAALVAASLILIFGLAAVRIVEAASGQGLHPAPARESSSAVLITDESQLLPGPAAQGQVGDLLIQNDRVAFVVESAEHVWGDALSGGHVVDGVAVASPSDRLDHVALSLVEWPRQAVYTSVAIESDGTSGPAVVRAEGLDSGDSALSVVTRYVLEPGAGSLELRTTVRNNGGADAAGYAAGDAIDWSYGDNFAAGYGFDISGATTFSEWIGCHHATTSYAYGKPSGTLQSEHGYTWSDTRLYSGTIAAGDSITLTRYLAAGAQGLSSASDAVLEAQGVPTGVVEGRVSSAATSEGLAGASVDCRVNGVPFYTRCVAGSSGVYRAELPPAGFSFEVSVDGYFDAAETAVVAAGGTTRVDLELMPTDYPVGRGDTLTVVMRPILAVPAIVVDGESFVIEAMASPQTTAWSATLAHGAREHALTVEGAAYEADLERWFLTAAVPEDVPQQMYDLVVEASGGVSDTVAHAVAVRDTIPTDFYFAHITDTHLPNHIFYGNAGWDTDTTEIDDLRAVIDDLNLANPAFVLLSGDVVNEGEAEDFMGQRAFTKSMRVLSELDMPVFLVAGNHDVGGWESMPPSDGTSRREWWRFFGWRYLASPPPGEQTYTQNYSFDFGGVHFVGLEAYVNYDGWRMPIYGWESFTAPQMQWLAQDLALVDETTPRILFYHYDFDHELDLGALGVDGTLWGHIHTSWGSIHERPFDLATDNVCDGDRAMRFVHVSDGDVSPSAPVEAGYSGLELSVSFDAPNDGTNYRLTATVVNRHAEHFDDALVRFEVPADSIPYRTSAGAISQTIVDGDVAYCFAHFDLPNRSTVQVSIEPTGETEDPLDGASLLLSPGFPNPTHTGTTLRFVLASAGDVRLSVFNVAGRLVRTLHDGPADAGENAADWDLLDESGHDVASGIYFARLESAGESVSRKLVVLR